MPLFISCPVRGPPWWLGLQGVRVVTQFVMIFFVEGTAQTCSWGGQPGCAHLQLQGHNIPCFLTGALTWLGLPSMSAAITLWVRSHLGSFLWSVGALELIENDVCGLNSSSSPSILLGSYVNQWMQTLWGWASILPSAKYRRQLLPPSPCSITFSLTCDLFSSSPSGPHSVFWTGTGKHKSYNSYNNIYGVHKSATSEISIGKKCLLAV